jgi:carbonic anhydrase
LSLLAVSIVPLASCGGPVQEAPHSAEAPRSAEAPHWEYEGEHGTEHWGELSPDFALCGTGRSQSPIDIVASAAGSLPPLAAGYAPAALHIAHQEHVADEINTGHSIQVNYPGADALSVGDESFTLVHYHFHSPSEHTLNGRPFPMEMHLVHKSAQGELAVIGVLIEEGTANAAFDPVWANLPDEKGETLHLEHVRVDVDQLLPRVRTTYRYEGSLTAPPCTEGVKWFVMTTPLEMSAEQIAQFRSILHGNNRPPQPLNGRVIATDALEDDSGP